MCENAVRASSRARTDRSGSLDRAADSSRLTLRALRPRLSAPRARAASTRIRPPVTEGPAFLAPVANTLQAKGNIAFVDHWRVQREFKNSKNTIATPSDATETDHTIAQAF